MDLTPLRRMNRRAENIPGPRARRLPIGQLLVERGELAPADQLHVLGLQSRVDASYGRILLARGLVDTVKLAVFCLACGLALGLPIGAAAEDRPGIGLAGPRQRSNR